MAYKLTSCGADVADSISATFYNELKKCELEAIITKENDYIVGKFKSDKLGSNFVIKMTTNDLDEYVHHETVKSEINFKIIEAYLDVLTKNQLNKGIFLASYNSEQIEIKEI